MLTIDQLNLNQSRGEPTEQDHEDRAQDDAASLERRIHRLWGGRCHATATGCCIVNFLDHTHDDGTQQRAVLLDLFAYDEAIEKQIHAHLTGADVEAALDDVAFSRINFATDLDLAIFVAGMKNPTTGGNRCGENEREENQERSLLFVAAAIHDWRSRS